MKIKCPYCINEIECINSDDLLRHFYRQHPTEYMTKYTELLFKIHEKIEELEPIDDYMRSVDVTRELKSLLEN